MKASHANGIIADVARLPCIHNFRATIDYSGGFSYVYSDQLKISFGVHGSMPSGVDCPVAKPRVEVDETLQQSIDIRRRVQATCLFLSSAPS
jgi:hypothetical protein